MKAFKAPLRLYATLHSHNFKFIIAASVHIKNLILRYLHPVRKNNCNLGPIALVQTA